MSLKMMIRRPLRKIKVGLRNFYLHTFYFVIDIFDLSAVAVIINDDSVKKISIIY